MGAGTAYSPVRSCFSYIDRSHSPRLTRVSFNGQFAMATPCAHVHGRYYGPSNFRNRGAPVELGHRPINKRDPYVVEHGP